LSQVCPQRIISHYHMLRLSQDVFVIGSLTVRINCENGEYCLSVVAACKYYYWVMFPMLSNYLSYWVSLLHWWIQDRWTKWPSPHWPKVGGLWEAVCFRYWGEYIITIFKFWPVLCENEQKKLAAKPHWCPQWGLCPQNPVISLCMPCSTVPFEKSWIHYCCTCSSSNSAIVIIVQCSMCAAKHLYCLA